MCPKRTEQAPRKGRKGSFSDEKNGLLEHFDEAQRSSKRRWPESFGYERRKEPKKGGPFIAHGLPQSSSDS
jgi:hypothetical protein